MTIETKYNIGDGVVQRLIIDGIRVDGKETKESVLRNGSCIHFWERNE